MWPRVSRDEAPAGSRGISAFTRVLDAPWGGPQVRAVLVALPANIAHDLAALVLEHVRTFRALQGGLGILIAERRGLLVINLGGAGVLRPAASALRKVAHALERAGMVLRRRFLEQRARRDIVLWPAGAVRHQQPELKLRLRIRLSGARQ